MATYAIADIHGRYFTLRKLLRKVDFDVTKDELYVLGDIIDRDKHSPQMIQWAYEQPASVHFLLGNHEDMMLREMSRWEEYLQENKDERESPYLLDSLRFNFIQESVWTGANGGLFTFNYLSSLPKPFLKDILNWVFRWPLFYDIEVNGKRFIMVHAGLAQSRRLEDSFLPGGVDKYVEIDGIGEVWSQHLLWVRDRWFYSNSELPAHVLFGHSPTGYIVDHLIWDEADYSLYNLRGEAGSFLHFGAGQKKHALDTGRSRMGILRLDDMAEFYQELDEDELGEND